ncbi:glycine cleavage H-protein [Toxoplasma gondii RUB]|uniref:Glycine cleavage H-protein n=6 Tax=Toxoplasma gondii TaxID=5811 RepID=S7WAP0_TOXGG|nr:glycine cleavage H-protein [Toxoplasma gondii GT1]KAF4642877.1 glycine cleavage H-protein [Toxoplasma gondii]KFG37718.1 glycine cleavage H-protein [Toxoplasma gondii GAB2-2007-GAL-DOM2]KFG53693.1 glycine cleavage H-protein [Toxoplasma gondii FOU]KFG61907.1 glycine cleavage H-protein [Toxoplasma gondii RUB]RQX73244.1 glycine cleavage H-protein [Toxoplasma gondii CAST]
MRPCSPSGQFLIMRRAFARPGFPHSPFPPFHLACIPVQPGNTIRGRLLRHTPRVLSRGFSDGQLIGHCLLASSSRPSGCRVFSSLASASSVVAPNHLGVYYSKTHEYVRLTLDCPPTQEESCTTSASSPEVVASETPKSSERVLFGVVGISAYAAEELGEVVYVDFPERLAQAGSRSAEMRKDERARAGEEDASVKKGSAVCSLESVKSVAEVYSPVDGLVVEVNEKVREQPSLVFQDPEGQGWLLKLRLPQAEAEEGGVEKSASALVAKVTKRLMDEERYATFVEREKNAGALEDCDQ